MAKKKGKSKDWNRVDTSAVLYELEDVERATEKYEYQVQHGM